jgi:hypothetical protein
LLHRMIAQIGRDDIGGEVDIFRAAVGHAALSNRPTQIWQLREDY